MTEIAAETLRIPHWDNAEAGQVVTLFGAAPADSATDLAERLGTIGEEIVLRLASDLPRTYRG